MELVFLHCRDCGAVEREPALVAGVEASDEGRDDFAARHGGHAVRRLEAASETYVSEAAYGAQVPLAFQQLRDEAGGRYLLEVRRPSAGRPHYRLLEGGLVRVRQRIRADEAAIARVLAEALALPVEAVEGAAKRLAALVEAESEGYGFERLEAQAVAGPTPLIAHAPLPAEALPALVGELRRLLGPDGLGQATGRVLSPRDVDRLLDVHAGPGGAFAPILESGYAVLGAGGAVEAHVRRVRAERDARQG